MRYTGSDGIVYIFYLSVTDAIIFFYKNKWILKIGRVVIESTTVIFLFRFYLF